VAMKIKATRGSQKCWAVYSGSLGRGPSQHERRADGILGRGGEALGWCDGFGGELTPIL